MTDENFKDLLVTALEGGSNYWYFIRDGDWKSYKIKGDTLVDTLMRALVDGKIVGIDDIENPNESLGHIKYQDFQEALDKVKELYPDVWARIISEDYDASDADIWFQLVVMGEVIFG